MRIAFRVGDVEFHGVPFSQFEDFPAFSENWSASIVPGRELLNSWDHVSQSWSRPTGQNQLRVAPGLQCLVLDDFGQRDALAESAMMARVLGGLGVSMPALKASITDRTPSSLFAYDTARAVPEAARMAASWHVFGRVRFDHLVLRFPSGRVTDWAILSVATDFVLSRRRIGQALTVETGPASSRSGTLAERVFDMMSGARLTDTPARTH